MILRNDRRSKLIVTALSHDFSRHILDSTMSASKSVMDLVRERGIPMTSAYRRVKELLECGLLEIERIDLTHDGKKYDLYRSTIRAINVHFENGILEVELTLNTSPTEKMLRRFLDLREAK